MRILDLLRFERLSSLFSASFFFASFLLCFSALLFFSGHPTITPSFHLPFASRIARELQVNRTGGEPYQVSSAVQTHRRGTRKRPGGRQEGDEISAPVEARAAYVKNSKGDKPDTEKHARAADMLEQQRRETHEHPT